MIRIVDKNGVNVVQKITKPNGKLVCYLAGVPGDYGLLRQFPTLAAARADVGIATNTTKE